MEVEKTGYTFATICSSNVNRSMEAHDLLRKNNYHVVSYGTGNNVNLPGISKHERLTYRFGTDYEVILNDLKSRNEEAYTRSELIPMIQRDIRVKRCPERFQDEKDIWKVDVCICFDDRVFDCVVEDLQLRGCHTFKPIVVFGIHVVDKQSSAVEGAKKALLLAGLISECKDLERDCVNVKKRFEEDYGVSLLFSLFYV